MQYILYLILGAFAGVLIAYLVFLFIQSKNKRMLEENRQAYLKAENENARLVTENRLLKEQAAKDEDIQKSLSERFENLANRIFDEKDKKNTEKIKLVLEPIEKDIHHFRKRIEDLNSGTRRTYDPACHPNQTSSSIESEYYRRDQKLDQGFKGRCKKTRELGRAYP